MATVTEQTQKSSHFELSTTDAMIHFAVMMWRILHIAEGEPWVGCDHCSSEIEFRKSQRMTLIVRERIVSVYPPISRTRSSRLDADEFTVRVKLQVPSCRTLA